MNNSDSDSAGPLPLNSAAVPRTASQKAAALKARLAKILAASGTGTAEPDDRPSHFTLGVDRIDTALRGNAGVDGLPRSALHELHAQSKDHRTSAAAMDPSAILHVDAPDSIAALRAAADGVRSSAMSTVIVELAGKKPKGLDLTATRRLSLSAQKAGVLGLLLRCGSDADNPLPTAAFSRWQVAAAPSLALEANAPGHPAFDITLLRHRSGLYGLSARLEWNRDEQAFREQPGEGTPHAGAVPALAGVRADHPGMRAA